MLYIAVFFIFALHIVLFVIRIKAAVEYTRDEQDEWVVFSFYSGKGAIRYEFEVPLVRKEKGRTRFKLVRGQSRRMRGGSKASDKTGPDDIIKKIISAWQYLKDHGSLLEDIRKYLNRHDIQADIEVKLKQGTGDAARTGLVCGALWSAAGILTAHLSRHLKIRSERIKIIPCFNEKVLEVEARCIFHVRLVHIIVVLIKIYSMKHRIKMKSQKATGGEASV